MDDDRDSTGQSAPADAEPPPLPDIRRRIRLYPSQWVGLPVLLLIPLLALLGVFGETRATHEVALDGVRYTVEYPTRLRAGQSSTIEVTIDVGSAAPGDTLTIAFDPHYVERFANVALTPTPRLPYDVELAELRPGASTVVRLELEARTLWRARGTIRLRAPGSAGSDVAISTFVFP